jgi:riboflavin kinase/FMN adenylyltransferase
MDVIEGRLKEMPKVNESLAVTMGNFDGVHLGHCALIQRLKGEAQKRGLKTAVLSFHPHPSEFFKLPQFQYLQTKAQKVARLEKLGLDFLFLQDFHQGFADLSPQAFVNDYLIPSLSPELILSGYDFTFGKKGQGDFSFLKECLKSEPVEVLQDKALVINGKKVSSSLIRSLLAQGQVKEAGSYLGYNYKIEGKVSRGDGIGQQLGFPTANLSEIHTLLPADGVYWGWCYKGEKAYKAVLNNGVRPTIGGKEKRQVEAHLLDFSADIYDSRLEFEFLGKIRNEKKFKDRNDLVEQIERDVEQTRAYFKEFAHV